MVTQHTDLISVPRRNSSILHHDCSRKTVVVLKCSPDHTVRQITW